MDSNNVILWIVRQIGFSGIALAVGLCSFGFGTFPSQQGHEAYIIGVLLILGVWIYERFLKVMIYHDSRKS